MTRAIPSAIATALAQPSVAIFYAVEMLFDGGPVRLWTGYGERVIEGNTYFGAGAFLAINGIEEGADLSAKGITVTLAGADPAVISLALQEPYQGRRARVLMGVDGVSDIVEIYAGLMDVMSPYDDGQTATIELSIENRMVTMGRANVRRYTSESHRSRNPNDGFFDYVSGLQDIEFSWGRNGSVQMPIKRMG